MSNQMTVPDTNAVPGTVIVTTTTTTTTTPTLLPRGFDLKLDLPAGADVATALSDPVLRSSVAAGLVEYLNAKQVGVTLTADQIANLQITEKEGLLGQFEVHFDVEIDPAHAGQIDFAWDPHAALTEAAMQNLGAELRTAVSNNAANMSMSISVPDTDAVPGTVIVTTTTTTTTTPTLLPRGFDLKLQLPDGTDVATALRDPALKSSLVAGLVEFLNGQPGGVTLTADQIENLQIREKENAQGQYEVLFDIEVDPADAEKVDYAWHPDVALTADEMETLGTKLQTAVSANAANMTTQVTVPDPADAVTGTLIVTTTTSTTTTPTLLPRGFDLSLNLDLPGDGSTDVATALSDPALRSSVVAGLVKFLNDQPGMGGVTLTADQIVNLQIRQKEGGESGQFEVHFDVEIDPAHADSINSAWDPASDLPETAMQNLGEKLQTAVSDNAANMSTNITVPSTAVGGTVIVTTTTTTTTTPTLLPRGFDLTLQVPADSSDAEIDDALRTLPLRDAIRTAVVQFFENKLNDVTLTEEEIENLQITKKLDASTPPTVEVEVTFAVRIDPAHASAVNEAWDPDAVLGGEALETLVEAVRTAFNAMEEDPITGPSIITLPEAGAGTTVVQPVIVTTTTTPVTTPGF
ncbi:unnamed protein product [Amoebophrya sp. A120]|nr:unnamed protein product [Amoebophrya sp. A120]|eukprot:GSA120T00013933001.1